MKKWKSIMAIAEESCKMAFFIYIIFLATQHLASWQILGSLYFAWFASRLIWWLIIKHILLDENKRLFNPFFASILVMCLGLTFSSVYLWNKIQNPFNKLIISVTVAVTIIFICSLFGVFKRERINEENSPETKNMGEKMNDK